MNSIDERIKRELEAESLDVDRIIGDTGGVNDMFFAALKGSTGGIVKAVIAVTTLIAIIAIYCIWRFIGAVELSDQITWAFWSLISGISMIGMELWAWMEINRAATQRSITRLELAIRDKYSNFEG